MFSELIYSTRREFLHGTLGTLSLSATMPVFLVRTAEAALEEDKPNGKILVMVQLAGGNDGLNTVVPYADDNYYRARPGLAIKPDEVLKIDDHVGLHPALGGMKELYDDGLLAIVQGVGYPNPNHSHFKSMDIWHTADPAGRKHTGWLGRYIDNCCKGSDPPKPNAAIALMPEAPLALMGKDFSPLAFQDEHSLRWRSKNSSDDARKLFAELNDGRPAKAAGKGKKKHKNEALNFLRRAALQARLGAEEVHAAAKGRVHGPKGGPRDSLQAQLSLVLQMIAADFPTSVYYVSMGGFDTHVNQANHHQWLLTQLGTALQSFMAELKQHKLAERVLIASFSEFGRRVEQNASGGTDHGTAAPMFLVGPGVKPGLYHKHPPLDRLDGENLIHSCDFRRVYAAILRDWLDTPPQRILHGQFAPLKIIA
ncbi:MAG: DUF1501 domain-containing protein [Planctomycetes bacterium]|nr:DUF1501 domain-containing protein [Planctomycetota bacterium]